ncbi:MAG: ATP-binding protein, partial [Oscillospiraceae bacterium]|nr:ATP-binding protein [Oscillospiraceae bacterium]
IKYCLDKIDNAAGHLLGVINDILDISKIESGKFTLSTDVWTFDVLMQRVANVINFKVDEKHQNFTINVDDDVPAALNADQQRLAQILTNLLSNAVRFTANGGRIGLHVSMIEQNDTQCTLQFAVKDNGIGIPAEKQASIFQSFEQADTSISRRFGGTGLGLAICKSIIEAMKGNIWVESEEGKGSTFFFTVQVGKVLSDYTDDADDDADSAGKGADSTTTSDGADGSDHGTEKEHVHEQAHEHKHSESLYGSEALKGIFAGRCVLLAEDMEINSEILAALLADTGVVLDFAWDGNQAYDMFASQPDKYDLIMMDINMPNMDGYGATQAIRSLQGEKAATIPIIAMTANVFREDIEKCLEVGMDDHIGKPVELEDVVNKLRKYMH